MKQHTEERAAKEDDQRGRLVHQPSDETACASISRGAKAFVGWLRSDERIILPRDSDSSEAHCDGKRSSVT
jgi:hypothetical protein